ncbi:MAG: ATP-binding protein [Cyanobacteria bacterium J06607_13]
MSSCLNLQNTASGAASSPQPTPPNQTPPIHPSVERYERLLAGVAASTNVLLTSQNYRKSIDQALSILGEATGVDRVYIFETHPHPIHKAPAMSQRWEWAAPGVAPEINNPDLQNLLYSDCFPRWYEKLSINQPVFGPVSEFPTEEREILEPQGILSILVVPIRIQNHFWGFVGFDQCQTVHAWTPVEVSTLWAIAGSFGGTVARHRAEVALQELNHSLEARVETRTQELTVANAELSAAMKKLRKTQSQLIHTEKMSSLGQLVAGIAHEINNPANFIFGNLKHAQRYAEDLLDMVDLYQTEYPEETPRIAEALDDLEFEFIRDDFVSLMASAREGVTRIRLIVESLRNFSRLDESECKQVDIHQGINSALNFLQHRLRSTVDGTGVNVITKFDSHLPPVECYSASLNQVFMNILTNAVDALEEKTREQRSQRPNELKIETLLGADGRVVVRIKDNGNGMKAGIRDKIFDPFFTSKPVGKGTGLGLSIAHQIVVREHHGEIKYQSAEGIGSTFEIWLPVRQVRGLINSDIA